MAALEPDVEFFGIRIPPNATVSFGDKDKRDDSSSSSGDDDAADSYGMGDGMPLVDGVALVHATQVALGPNPSPGRHTVMAVKSLGGTGKGRAFPIGTLEVGKTEQFSIDLMWSMLDADGGSRFDGGCGDVSFMHTGKSDVYITGYKSVTSLLDDERGYSGGEEESDDDEEEEEDYSSEEEVESDDEEAPQGVPLLQRAAKGGGGEDFSSPSDDDVDDEGDEDESDESDDEDGESSEEEEDGGGRAFAAAAPPRTPVGSKRPLGTESSDDESASDEDSESEDEEQPAAPPASKKAKQAPEQPADAAAYASALREFIERHGPTKLGALGAAVRRPASLPKLTTFLAGRSDFRVDGEQRVSLLSTN